MRNRFFLFCISTTLAYSFSTCGKVIADNQASQQMELGQALEAMQTGRMWESRGDLDEAASHYMWALNSAMGTIPKNGYESVPFCGEPLNVLARRILYMDQQLLKTPGRTKRSGAAIVGQIKNLYRTLETLEPSDPSWVYLDACLAAGAGNYVAAYPRAQKVATMPGADQDIRGRAQRLVAHIKPGYDAQLKWQEAQWKKWQAYVQSGEYYRSLTSSSSSSSSSSHYSDNSPKSIPDYERKARDAEYNGDSAAASRFRGGGDSCKDNAKYW